jgi:polyhydroxyalkanoate synthesis regulator protein
MERIPDFAGGPATHIVKRYAGTRLYDTTTLAYVTVAQVRALLRSDADVMILDAEDGADITHAVLALN